MQGYQIKVMIKHSKPPIWRRILVPDKISFRDLDDIIEEAFGWTHSHMFSFYFREADEYFQGGPIADREDTADMGIAGWLWEGCTFLYTYDFGDNWEHTITVEKVFPYDKRYPQVVKSKGPNMIEDCGGIEGFYDCIDGAKPFDMERLNAKFRTWDLAVVVEGEAYEDVDEEEGWSILDDLDGLEDVWDMDVLEDGEFADGAEAEGAFGENDFLESRENQDIDFEENLHLLMEEGFEEDDFPEDEELERLRGKFQKPSRLLDVYSHFKKGELEIVARANGFARHGTMKKAELASWLCGQLLNEQVFADCVFQASREEIEIFEEAIEKDGILLSEEIVGASLILCTYGAFLGNYSFYRVPGDVEKRYEEIKTPDFLKKREVCWTRRIFCDAAVYLYGVLPVTKLAEICRQYGDSEANGQELTDFIQSQIKCGVHYALRDGYLMSDMLLESSMYRRLLKTQESCTFYLPETRDEFLQYGELECQEPDEHTQFYLDFLQNKCKLSEERSLVVFYMVQEGLRMNIDEEELLSSLKSVGCSLRSERSKREALRQSRIFSQYVRHWDLRGHTPQEIQGNGEKIVPIFGNTVKNTESKIYPNDPCPCGSGKKYKHCCGKNKR